MTNYTTQYSAENHYQLLQTCGSVLMTSNSSHIHQQHSGQGSWVFAYQDQWYQQSSNQPLYQMFNIKYQIYLDIRQQFTMPAQMIAMAFTGSASSFTLFIHFYLQIHDSENQHYSLPLLNAFDIQQTAYLKPLHSASHMQDRLSLQSKSQYTQDNIVWAHTNSSELQLNFTTHV